MINPNGQYDVQGLEGNEVEMKWWDRATGDAYVCWKDNPDYCGDVSQPFLDCYDWSERGVSDETPKLPRANGSFTPNGTLPLPCRTGQVCCLRTSSSHIVQAHPADVVYLVQDMGCPNRRRLQILAVSYTHLTLPTNREV